MKVHHHSLYKIKKQIATYPYKDISNELLRKYLDDWSIIFDKKLGIYMII